MSNGKKLEMMSRIDSFWLSLDQPTNLMEIAAIFVMDGPVDFNKLLEMLEQRFTIHDRFRQTVVFPYTKIGPAYWYMDPDFDILHHVSRLALPAPGDKETLQKLVSELTCEPLNKHRPLWMIRLIENYNGNNTVMYLKLHHCIADGLALVTLANTLFDFQPNKSFKGIRNIAEREKTRIDHLKDKAKRRRGFASFIDPVFKSSSVVLNASRATVSFAAKIFEKTLEEILKAIAHPSYAKEMTKLIGQIAYETVSTLLRLLIMPKDLQGAFHGKIGHRKTMIWSDPFKVEEVKEIGKVMKGTINDVLMSAVAGALREYLLEVDDDPDAGEVRVNIPVNVRKDLSKVVFGNMFSIVFITLPVNIADPYRRLREIRKRMRRIKNSPEAFIGFQLLQSLGFLPTAVTRRAAALLAEKATGVLTNVPGPKVPIYLIDKEITSTMFWVPRTASASMGISIYSYKGEVIVGFSTDTRLIPDPEKISSFFQKELNYLLKLVKDKTRYEAFLKRIESEDEETKQEKIG